MMQLQIDRARRARVSSPSRFARRSSRLSVTLGMAGALVALGGSCGGGGGGGGSTTPPGGTFNPPTANIAFPPTGVVTDAATLFVRGNSQSPTTIASVEVDGVSAGTVDGFASWSAFVPLGQGPAALDVRTEDVDGRVDSSAASILVARVPLLLSETVGVAYDPLRNNLVLLDLDPGALVTVDGQTAAETVLVEGLPNASAVAVHAATDRALVTASEIGLSSEGGVLAFQLSDGVRSVFSGPGAGSGPVILDPRGIAINALGNVAYVADGFTSDTFIVDLSTGDRSVLLAVGPAAGDPTAIAFDPTRSRILITAEAGLALYAIDLATGQRGVLSNGGVGNGPAFEDPRGVRYDALRDRYLVTDAGLRALIAVDPFTGDRTIVSDDELGGGPFFGRPSGLAFDAGGRLFLADAGRDALLQVNPVTGVRSSVFDTSFGFGPLILDPVGIALNFAGDTAYVADRLGVYRVSIGLGGGGLAGERQLLSGGEIGDGPPFSELTGLVRLPEIVPAVPPQASLGDEVRTFVTDVQRLAVMSIANNGTRAVVSDPTFPGPALAGPRSIAILPDSLGGGGAPRAVLSDFQLAVGNGQLVEVDLSTGERRLLSGASQGGGPALHSPAATVGSSDGTELWTVDVVEDRIVGVRLPSGNRDVLSAGGGFAASFTGSVDADLVLDEALDRLLVVTGGSAQVVSVDLQTGLRTVLSSSVQGDGPQLAQPSALSLSGGSLFVTDRGRSSLLAVEVVSGARVLVSK